MDLGHVVKRHFSYINSLPWKGWRVVKKLHHPGQDTNHPSKSSLKRLVDQILHCLWGCMDNPRASRAYFGQWWKVLLSVWFFSRKKRIKRRARMANWMVKFEIKKTSPEAILVLILAGPSVFFVSIGNRGICHSWIAGKTHPAASMAACTQLSRNLGMNDHLGTTGLKCQQQHHSKWIRTRITGWSLWVHRIYATSIMKFWGWGGSLNEMFYFPLLVVGNRFPGKNRPWKTMILSYLKWPPLLEGTYPPGN